jgi:beta-lactamase regulating signal transducer with metallopeptidase domain
MIGIAYYLLKVTIISGLLFGYYHLALKDKVFHQWNRFYLLATVVVSLMVPLISFPVQTTEQHDSTIVSALQVVSGADEFVSDHQSTAVATMNVETLVSILFFFVSLALFTVLILAIIRIMRIAGKYDALQLDDIVFINTREEGTPFSFFKRIFWHEDIDLHSLQGKTIFEHEMVHVREMHSMDKLFIQLVLIPCWLNPVFWLIRKELKMIHEFIADNKSIENKERSVLAELILQTAYPQYSHLISNPFFQSSIKRRLSMLSKTNNPSMHYLSRIAALVLVSCLVLAFTIKPQFYSGHAPIKLAEKFRVVIDAGHGGVDPWCGIWRNNGKKYFTRHFKTG